MTVDRPALRRPFRWSFFVCLIVMLAGHLTSLFASQSVELSWNPSTSPNIVAYRAYYGTQSGVYPNSITFGNVTDVTIPALADGTTYYFAVAAIDANNYQSSMSGEAVYTTPAPGTIDLFAQNSTNAFQAVDLSWTASLDPDVYGYAINYGTQSGVYTNTVVYYGSTEALISGLSGGATYYFSISPVDSLGIGAVASDEASCMIPLPATLRLRASTAVNTEGIELGWNPILNQGVSSYYIYYGMQNGVYDNFVNAGNVTNYVLGGLVQGQTYYCTVVAVDDYGNLGQTSNPASGVAAGPVPVQIQVRATDAALEAVDVSWSTSADTNVYGYAVDYWIPGSGYTNSMNFFDGNDGIVSGLTGGATYCFAIAPIDYFGVEPIASATVSCGIPKPQPIVVSARASATVASVELTWNAVPNQGVTGYYIYFGTQSGSYSGSAYCGDGTDFVVQDLYGGETYYFAVAAVDSYGNQGPLSSEATATTVPPIPARLTMQTYNDDTGRPFLMEINTPTAVSGPWELDSSTDLRNWNLYTTGYGSGYGNGYDVDVYVSLDPSAPPIYFRLRQ